MTDWSPFQSTTSNESGYVYETEWDSAEDAREFAEAYRDLLAYHNAEPVSDREDTFRIPKGEEFADAFYVAQNGSRVTIVNALTVDALSEIRPNAGPPANDSDGGDETTPAEETTPTAATTATADSSGDEAGESGPGFGLFVTILALVTLTGLARRRGR